MSPDDVVDDAPLTRPPEDGGMTEKGEPLGALVIRVWRAPGADAPLIGRFVGRLDVESEETEPPDYAIGVDQIVERTREWLLRYVRATPES